MYSYLIGKVVEMNIDHIVVENNWNWLFDICQVIHMNIHEERSKDISLPTSQRRWHLLLYGFKTSEEKEMFLKLILVKGIGCKTAIGILATGDVTSIISAIETAECIIFKENSRNWT